LVGVNSELAPGMIHVGAAAGCDLFEGSLYSKKEYKTLYSLFSNLKAPSYSHAAGEFAARRML
jgi:hypothetical protein